MQLAEVYSLALLALPHHDCAAAICPTCPIACRPAAPHSNVSLPLTCSATCLSAGKMSRDLAISQTAAAMLAWFQQQLSHSSLKAAAAAAAVPAKASSPTAVQAAASAAHIPLATVGLNAAGLTAGPLTLGPAGSEGRGDESAAEGASGFGQEVVRSFKGWVLSPLAQQEVEFSVKGVTAV